MAKADALTGTGPVIPDSAARLDAPGSTRGNDRAAERARLKELAQEFEAMLMNEMLADWRRSLVSGDDSQDAGGFGTMTDMVGGEFGRALSRAGGLGIADVLLRSFERQQPGSAPADPGAYSTFAGSVPISGQTVNGHATAFTKPSPVAELTTGGPVQTGASAGVEGEFSHPGNPATAKVTSPYGWRADPFSGRSKFHAGTDMRMAYGEPVASMAAGRVSFAGDQGGYGLTVVVDHGDGLQTRYAHLSSTDVQAGDTVSRGQAIARSGNSGRSTAPHLHVEVLSQGRTIDPAGLLKSAGGSADWTAYQSGAAAGPDRTHEAARGESVQVIARAQE